MSQPPTPPSCSECATKAEAAGGSSTAQSSSRMWRSSSGQMRIDTPHSSIISNPAAQKTILLDHLKKEATIIPMPRAPEACQPEVQGCRVERHRLKVCMFEIPPGYKLKSS